MKGREKKREKENDEIKFHHLFEMKFHKERNYKFFWTSLPLTLNTKLSLLVIKYNSKLTSI